MTEEEAHRHVSFLGYRIYCAQSVVSQVLANALSLYEVSPAQWNALNQLERLGPLSQRQLASYLHREPATITRSIDKMEAAGLVSREPDPHDRRTNLITLKPVASELLSEVQPAVEQAAATIEGNLSDEEVKTLISLLDRVYENCVSSLKGQ